ncbi:MAG: hypothetical protein JWR34_3415 [Mycobacterium sp.]|nr:hypothetical protein [Mycobacterium sp.]
MSDYTDELRRYAAEAEQYLAKRGQAKHSQPARLAEARAKANAERENALAAEPWADMITGIPTIDPESGELTGIWGMPNIDGKEVFGTRLAFDLLGCCADEDQVAETLRECFKMTGDPGHAFLVCAAALETIANHVMPALLDTYEDKSGDYETRVRLADAARNAWAARVADLGEFAEADE